MRDPFGILRTKKSDAADVAKLAHSSPMHPNILPVAEQMPLPTPIAKALVSIATHAWKASSRSLNTDVPELAADLKRVQRNLAGILESLREIGIEVRDHTGDTFDYGLPLKVVTAQPTPGIDKEVVLETLRPTIFWNNNIVQMGEVIISTPIKTGESHD